VRICSIEQKSVLLWSCGFSNNLHKSNAHRVARSNRICGFAARCAEKLRFSGSLILYFCGYAAVPNPPGER
jgi:hypothetical protein